MSSLFSRRSKAGNHSSNNNTAGSSSANKGNRFGQGISNTDVDLLDEFGRNDKEKENKNGLGASFYAANADAAQEVPVRRGKKKDVSSSSNKGTNEHGYSSTANALLSPTSPPRIDDFGRMAPRAATSSRNAQTLPTDYHRSNPMSSLPLSPQRATSLRMKRDLPALPPANDRAGQASTSDSAHGKEAYPYGYTHDGWDIEVSLASAIQVVEVCGKEIRERGLDAPLIFSSLALDLSESGAAALIKAFQNSNIEDLQDSPFAEDARYADPHNLAAMIKWTLARLCRFYTVPVPSVAAAKRGEVQEEVVIVQQRGWLEMEPYLAWKDEEKAAQYPWTAFSNFCLTIDVEAAELLRSLFSLLSSTSSYSRRNGMSPSKLSRLFGALLFGLPEDETFSRTYDAHVRASNATEHLFLAYIRDLAAYEVLPVRLMTHVEGYPGTLSADPAKPPMHARNVPVVQIERQVRLYSQDLIQSACDLDLEGQSDLWAACCSKHEHAGKEPQLSERYRKLLNIRNTTRPGGKGSTADSGLHSKSANDDPSSYTTIAEEQWGKFLNDGFAEPDASKLAFNVKEGHRRELSKKRDTVHWTDFEMTGFNDKVAQLDAALSFDEGLREEMEKWPGEKAELIAKLQDAAAKAPPFNYDSEPRVVATPTKIGSPVLVERGEGRLTAMDESFAEVWADYLIGNGWSNRDELTHRNANFVIVQYKSRPTAFTATSQKSAAEKITADLESSLSLAVEGLTQDDRTDSAWFIVQEIVPGGYRADLERMGKSKSRSRPTLRKINVFRKVTRKGKEEGKDKTLTRRQREKSTGTTAEPDMWPLPAGTKKLTLSTDTVAKASRSADEDTHADGETTPRGWLPVGADGSINGSRRGSQGRARPSDGDAEPGPTSSPANEPSGKGLMSALRIKSLRNRSKNGSPNLDSLGNTPSIPPKRQGAQTGGFKQTSDFGSDDFETHSVYDPEDTTKDSGGKKKTNLLHRKRGSKDDAWIDVITKDDRYKSSESAAGLGIEGVGNDQTPKAAFNVISPTTEELYSSHGLGTSAGLGIGTDNGSHSGSNGKTSPVGGRNSPAPKRPELSPRTSSLELRRDFKSSPRPGTDGGASGLNKTAIPSATATDRRTSPLPDEELNAFPQPPPINKSPRLLSPALAGNSPRLPSTGPAAENRPRSVSPTFQNAEEAERVPTRADLRRVEADQDDSDAQKQAKISAALVRARELRAKLQPVGTTRKASGSEDGSTSAESTANTRDPFSKNPTSGKVASIAARFGHPDAPASALGSSKGMSSASSTSSSSVRPVSPSGLANDPAAAKNLFKNSAGVGYAAIVGSGGKNRSVSPTPGGPGAPGNYRPSNIPIPVRPQASFGGMVDPDAPPSPRKDGQEYLYSSAGDTDSIAPDDAASNYGGSRESRPPSTHEGGGSGLGLAIGGGDHSSTGTTGTGSSGAGQFGDAEERAEMYDESTALPPSFREPYQLGQPLDNVYEESESVLSGS